MDEQLIGPYTEPPMQVAPALPHSGLGIASFIVCLFAGLGMFGMIALAGLTATSNPGAVEEESAVVLLIGLLAFGMVGLDIVALVLGIAGLCQKNRKKVFAILGSILSFLGITGIVMLVAIGLCMG